MPNRDSCRAFTLVELLVVMAIIAVLAGLLIVGIPAAMNAAKRAATAQRMENILTGLTVYGQESGQNAYALMRAAMRTPVVRNDGTLDPVATMPDDLNWLPLQQVIEEIWTGTSLATMTGSRKELLPNLAFTRNPASGTYAFLADDWTWWMDADAPGACANKPHSLINTESSQLGERLDSTREIAAIGAVGTPTRRWFRRRWPIAWPASDWDQPAPGNVGVRWGAPWGRQALDPATLVLAPPASRNLSELSPLDSIRLLQVAGVLDGGDAGQRAYREDRSPSRPWNDRWGQPLVVVSAAFVPNRAEVCQVRTFPTFNPAPATPPAWTLLGMANLPSNSNVSYVGGSPRDALLSGYTQAHGFNRAVYCSVGAIGPVLRTPLPATWSAAEDAVVLRELWLQIREVTAAQSWTETGFANPPWNGVRNRKQGRERCQLSAPIEIH